MNLTNLQNSRSESICDVGCVSESGDRFGRSRSGTALADAVARREARRAGVLGIGRLRRGVEALAEADPRPRRTDRAGGHSRVATPTRRRPEPPPKGGMAIRLADLRRPSPVTADAGNGNGAFNDRSGGRMVWQQVRTSFDPSLCPELRHADAAGAGRAEAGRRGPRVRPPHLPLHCLRQPQQVRGRAAANAGTGARLSGRQDFVISGVSCGSLDRARRACVA